MKQYDFSRVIKTLREKHNLTQFELAALLGYSVPTISKIENGKQVPPFAAIENALQRLGEDSRDFFVFFLDGDEKLGYRTMQTLRHLYDENSFEKMRKLIADVENKKPFTSGLFLQFIIFGKAVSDNSLSEQEKLELLTKAIMITRKVGNDKALFIDILSTNEISILSEIAATHHRLGDNENAVQIMSSIKASMDRDYFDGWEKSRTYPQVLYNLSVYLGELDRDEEAYEACVIARIWAIRYNNMRLLPNILGVIAHYQYQKGDRRSFEDTFMQAYYTARAMERYHLSELIKEVAKREYGINLDRMTSLWE